MRGKDNAGGNRQWSQGITPAYAGKSRECAQGLTPAQDHPRVCGEKGVPHRGGTRCRGSPPRMRGKGLQGHQARCRHGITPAYAGKRFTRTSSTLPPWDHPRVCGEKSPKPDYVAIARGSPPRMRGKGGASRPSWPPAGITPAYAGKSGALAIAHRSRRDHPRVCGEKSRCRPASGPWPGSPPRMRGKAGYWVKDAQGRGITPAYAGKSRKETIKRRGWKDHPRVCGEKLIWRIAGALVPGSPPRMRGKAAGVRSFRWAVGITPAYAGKSKKGRAGAVF